MCTKKEREKTRNGRNKNRNDKKQIFKKSPETMTEKKESYIYIVTDLLHLTVCGVMKEKSLAVQSPDAYNVAGGRSWFVQVLHAGCAERVSF